MERPLASKLVEDFSVLRYVITEGAIACERDVMAPLAADEPPMTDKLSRLRVCGE